jgi:hypothetical protein
MADLITGTAAVRTATSATKSERTVLPNVRFLRQSWKLSQWVHFWAAARMSSPQTLHDFIGVKFSPSVAPLAIAITVVTDADLLILKIERQPSGAKLPAASALRAAQALLGELASVCLALRKLFFFRCNDIPTAYVDKRSQGHFDAFGATRRASTVRASSQRLAAAQDFDRANDRSGSFTSFPLSRRVRFAPRAERLYQRPLAPPALRPRGVAPRLALAPPLRALPAWYNHQHEYHR